MVDGGTVDGGTVDGGWVVEADGVVVRYGEVVALDGVSLHTRAGEVHGLLGPNGAGKTTLLSVLFGMVRPDEGTLRLFGRSQRDAGAAWLRGVGGFVEAPSFYPYLSGRGNLDLLASLDAGDAHLLVGDVLDIVGLARVADERVRGYSLGMRQRLGLAAALLRRPRLLILDEPTNGLDPAGIRDVQAGLRALADGGASVVLSSHDMAQVDEVCDCATLLDGGRTRYSGPLDRLRAMTPDPVWTMRTTDDVQARLVAGSVAGVRAGRSGDHLTVVATPEQLDEYVLLLGRSGVRLRALGMEGASLESVFLTLTGAGAP